MHHKLDKDTVYIFDKEGNIKEAIKTKLYTNKYNIDLLDVLLKNGEYKTKYHYTPQKDLDI